MSILVVDDNPVNLTIIEKILHNEGYRDCVLLHSASELFDYLRIDSPETSELSVDLILLDMMMPEIDGIQACHIIQQSERLRNIPIIFVTALGDSRKLAEALDAGAIDYVMKPINKIELIARIRVALRLKHEKDLHIQRDRKIQTELDLAKQVQRSVLSKPLDHDKIQITSCYMPSFELAGDMYSWFQIDEHRYGIILLDMMGHGISSALVCMFISSVLRDTITKLVDPEEVISELNRYMYQLYRKEDLIHYYFTAIYLVIDTKEKTIEYVNAGHPIGLALLDRDKLVYLDKGSCAVGFFEQIEVEKSVIRYEEEMRIVLYTDGLLEALEEEVGEDPMKKLKVAIFNNDADPHETMHFILPDQLAVNQNDDICLMVISTK